MRAAAQGAGPAVARLGAGDLAGMRAVNALFAEVFEDAASYASAPPSDAWLARQLARDDLFVLVALDEGETVAALVAYEMAKLEQERREIYLYDLAVAASHRRRGLASALIGRLRVLARERGAWMIFVQGDPGDGPALALYDRLGRREAVLHFDIEPADAPVPAIGVTETPR